MNIIKEKIKGIWGKILGKDRVKVFINPERDWASLIIAFAMAVAFIFSFYLYILWMRDGSAEQTFNASDISTAEINKVGLEKALKPWREKEVKFKELLVKGVVFIDPTK